MGSGPQRNKSADIMKGIVLATVAWLTLGTAYAQSPLADAIQNGHRLEAQALIDEGADVNAAQGDGTTPLHWATYKIDVPLVQQLLERGANAAAVAAASPQYPDVTCGPRTWSSPSPSTSRPG